MDFGDHFVSTLHNKLLFFEGFVLGVLSLGNRREELVEQLLFLGELMIFLRGADR